MTRRIEFRPPALRALAAMDPAVQRQIVTALERFAGSGHGDVKKLQGRPDFRLRVGKWRVFFLLNRPGVLYISGIDNRGQAY